MTLQRLRAWVNEGTADTVIVAGVDMMGQLYGKREAADTFITEFAGGVNTCDCTMGWDIDRKLIDGFDLTSWDTGYGDIVLVPDYDTLRHWPWFEKTVLVLCDTCDVDGNLLPVAPRTVLRRQVDKARAMGFEVKAAPEIEFVMFSEDADTHRLRGYRDLKPIGLHRGSYSIYRDSMNEHIKGYLRRNLKAAGIPVLGSRTEGGLGQMEINMVFTDALRMADQHALFKGAVREMAALRGLQVSFMPKWDEAHAGNGCHVHMSLWRGEENAFADTVKGHPTDTLRHFLGGLMALTRDLQWFYAPTINAYKRYRTHSYSPINVTWGVNNRTAGYRLCGHGKSARIENRIPGADVNPHLMYAAMIGAGLYGIEHKIEPIGPPVQNDAYTAVPEAPQLHRHMLAAVNALDASQAARDILGDDVVNHYVRLGQWETQAFMESVTDWERNRYFELS